MAEYKEPIFDVARLAYLEILTLDPEGFLQVFKDLLVLEKTELRTEFECNESAVT